MISEKMNHREISNAVIAANVCRLTNQLWKLIPMRENEENWRVQLETVFLEIVGLCELFDIKETHLILLTKLEGLRHVEVEFSIYRKTIFECISLLREICYA